MKANNPMKDPLISRKNALAHFKHKSSLEKKYEQLFQSLSIILNTINIPPNITTAPTTKPSMNPCMVIIGKVH